MGGPIGVKLSESELVFQNSLMSLPIAPHRSTMTFDFAGDLIGAAFVAFPDVRAALRLELTHNGHEGRWINLSSSAVPLVKVPMLRASSIESATGAAWAVHPGTDLTVLPVRHGRKLYAETHVRDRMRRFDEKQPPSFVGVVYELAGQGA